MPQQKQLEKCPDCRAKLPKPTYGGQPHPYIGASASCWTLFSYLWNAGEPPLAPFAIQPLILDAYCVQHHGNPSPQAIQSVAIHALTLYSVLSQDVDPSQTRWVRDRLLREMKIPRHERFEWLAPPPFEQCLTIAEIVQEPTPERRSESAQAYIQEVWTLWQQHHDGMLAHWYKRYVI